MARGIVAVEDSPTLTSTLRAAVALAAAFGLELTAVHVRAPDAPEPAFLAAEEYLAWQIPVQVVTGDVIEQLLLAFGGADVELGVVGAHRRRDDVGPLGHVAMGLAQRTGTSLLVVPPASSLARTGRLHRVLVPLDGHPDTTDRVAALVSRLRDAGIDIVVTHVFEADHLPAYVDDAAHSLDAWQREFAARHLTPGQQVQLRRGHPWEAIRACAVDIGADLVVLAWSQQTEAGRGAVVRAVLVDLRVPVLLLPRGGTRVADEDPARSVPGRRDRR
jgi:nucleotide-binding universal stress UspA family protein